jgi:hypothetical protein
VRSHIGESASTEPRSTATTTEVIDEHQSILDEEPDARPLDIPPSNSAPVIYARVQHDEVVRVPSVWDFPWTEEIICQAAPDSLNLNAPKKDARQIVDLMRLNRKLLEKFGGEFAVRLNDLRWAQQLINLNLGPEPASITVNIATLVDEKPCLSKSLQAPSWRTLALMIAAWDVLVGLYLQLCARAAKPELTKSMPHMEWNQLPVRALLVGCLTLGAEPREFQYLLAQIFEKLSIFGNDVKAQVHADLCALCLSGTFEDFEVYVDILDDLDMPESKPHLENIEHLKIVCLAYSSKKIIDLECIIALAKILPHAGGPWNLFAIVTMKFLSNLYGGNLLSPGSIPELRNQTTEMFLVRKATELIRYFMSLTSPGQFQLFSSAVDYLNVKLAAAAFMNLSPEEKISFLRCYPPELDWRFITKIEKSLMPNEMRQLIHQILSQRPESMDKVIAVLRHRLGLLEGPLSGQL